MEKQNVLGLLKRHGISPSHLLDQNFMTDSRLIKRIVSLAWIKTGETVLEIGAGIGTLTPEIASKARKVIAVDIDKAFAPALKESCPANVEILTGNILKIIGGLKFQKIISNTPYSICEPLLQKLAKTQFKLAVLTLPRKFIERLKEGGSRLYLFASAFFRIEEKLEISREAFYPEPKVESGAMVLWHKTRADYRKDPCSYILRKLFLQDDKKLKNALREALIDLHRDILKNGITNSKEGGFQRGRVPLGKRMARDIIKTLKIPKASSEALVRDLTGKEILGIEGKCRRLISYC